MKASIHQNSKVAMSIGDFNVNNNDLDRIEKLTSFRIT